MQDFSSSFKFLPKFRMKQNLYQLLKFCRFFNLPPPCFRCYQRFITISPHINIQRLQRYTTPGSAGPPGVEPWEQTPLQLARPVALALRRQRPHPGNPARGGHPGRSHHCHLDLCPSELQS